MNCCLRVLQLLNRFISCLIWFIRNLSSELGNRHTFNLIACSKSYWISIQKTIFWLCCIIYAACVYSWITGFSQNKNAPLSVISLTRNMQKWEHLVTLEKTGFAMKSCFITKSIFNVTSKQYSYIPYMFSYSMEILFLFWNVLDAIQIKLIHQFMWKCYGI